ncbi:MAG TPA: hypothetical protein VFK04_15510 [Gemmatimonadaceae bacterium]|nr:hypothetical protein [Gemmatimonadaceae bacterium]
MAVTDALGSPGESAGSIASKTLNAAAASLRNAPQEPGCYLPLLQLSRLAVAARSQDKFAEQLVELGIAEGDREDGLRLLVALEQASLGRAGRHTVYTDIAERAYREVLLGRVRAQAESLWGISPTDVRLALAAQSTENGYSEFARDWFSRFVGRTLQYFIDRELSNYVGQGAAENSGDAVRLEREVLAYANERTRILKEFSPGWLSKTLWTKGAIPEESAQRFFAYAIKKILDDVAMEADAP